MRKAWSSAARCAAGRRGRIEALSKKEQVNIGSIGDPDIGSISAVTVRP